MNLGSACIRYGPWLSGHEPTATGRSTRGERDHRVEAPHWPTFGDMRLALVTLAVLASAACSDRHDREAAAVDSAAAPSPELARVDTGITHPADSSPGPATTPAEE